MKDLMSFTDEYLIYLRKSRQDDPKETVEEVLAKHERILQEYALVTFGYRIKEENIYREVVSGETIEDRPKIKEVFKRIEKGNIKGVLVVDCSRLSRGDLVDCGTVVRAFLYTNTLVITPMRTLDARDKFDRRSLEMELTNGNYYLESAKEYMVRGRVQSSKEGYFVGSIPPYGYDRIKEGKRWILVINEQEAQYVRLAFDMYANQGIGANSIAHKLNEIGALTRKGELFKETSIRQMLKNEVYYGMICYQRKPVEKVMEDGKIVKKRVIKDDYILVKGKHSPIISEELFKKAQEQKNRVTREKPDLELKNPYAGLIKCKKCGKAIALRVHRKNGVKIRKDRYYCRGGIYCDNKSVNSDIVQKTILEALKQSLQDFKMKIDTNTHDEINERDSVVKSLEKQLLDLKKRQTDICDFLEKGIYSIEIFTDRNNIIKSDIERVEIALKKAREYVPVIKNYEEKVVSLHQAIDMLEDDTISAKIKNNFLKEVIDVIYYEKDVADSCSCKGSDESEFTLDIRLK